MNKERLDGTAKKLREETEEHINNALYSLLLGSLAKFALDEIDNDDMEVVNNYISKLRNILLNHREK